MNIMVKKSTFLSLLFFLSLLGFTQSTYAIIAPDGYYLNMFFGGAYFPAISSATMPLFPDSSTMTNTRISKLKFKAGFDLGGAWGYKFGPFRLENSYKWLLFEHHYVRFNGATLNKQGAGGATNFLATFINGYYDFDYLADEAEGNEFIPYIGLGIGYGRVRRSLKVDNDPCKYSATPPSLLPLSERRAACKKLETDNELAYQFIIGTQYNADSVTTFAIDYRYIGSTEANNALFGEKYQAHTVNISLTHHMDSLLFD